MTHGAYTWQIADPDRATVKAIAEALDLPRIVAMLIVNRGIDTVEAARNYLNPSLEQIGDPFNLIDMRKAVDRLARARDEGLVRFIGVTGHGLRIPTMHLRSLERFDFDSVLFPYNRVLLHDEAYRAAVAALRAVCAERGCGIVQLTSDKTRGDAIRFYEQLGFATSHEGLKLKL